MKIHNIFYLSLLKSYVMRHKLLYLDIETVSCMKHWDMLNLEWRQLWEHKSRHFAEREKGLDSAAIYEAKAAIYAEFGQVICVGLGIQDHDKFRVEAITGNEKEVLEEFFDLVEKSYGDARQAIFIGHNIREFDIPYLCRRAIVNGLKIPPSLDLSGKKPWEVQHIHDTLEMWRFGDYKNYTSLDLLASCLGLPTSKSDISGKDVGHVYWQENDLPRIARYCIQDVILTARVYKRIKGEPGVSDQDVVYA